jgi:glycosyltransferase involved in cell wall biosynthesis
MRFWGAEVCSCKTFGFDTHVTGFKQNSLFGDSTFDAKLEMQDIDLLPWVPRDKMPEYYRAASLTLCLGSLPEGFGLSAAESIACGTPVLSRRIGALPELVPDGHGLLVMDSVSESEVCAHLDQFIDRLRKECHLRGSPLIRRKYNEKGMVSHYGALAEQAMR